MIGAIEILIIAVIFGIIYGRDAIDKTFRKSANEGVVESMAGDLKEYYEEDPKRMIKLGVFIVSAILFFGDRCLLGYYPHRFFENDRSRSIVESIVPNMDIRVASF
jgi:hypothetical protein